MEKASSELTLTIVAIIAIGAVLVFITTFLTQGGDDLQEKWDNMLNKSDN